MPKKAKEEEVATGAVRFGRVRNNLKMGIVGTLSPNKNRLEKYSLSRVQRVDGIDLLPAGLPNVGKSSLFNLLTKQSVAAENFPFCTVSGYFWERGGRGLRGDLKHGDPDTAWSRDPDSAGDGEHGPSKSCCRMSAPDLRKVDGVV